MTEVSEQLGAVVLDEYADNVTHVIIDVDENNHADMSLKFLYGVAHKAWIVSIKWILECKKECRFEDESPFEVLDEEGRLGPCFSRISNSKLFDLYNRKLTLLNFHYD